MSQKEKKPRTKSGLREAFELLAETAVFVFFILTFIVQSFGDVVTRWVEAVELVPNAPIPASAFSVAVPEDASLIY